MKMYVLPQYNVSGRKIAKLVVFHGELNIENRKAFLIGKPHNLGPLHVFDLTISAFGIRITGVENIYSGPSSSSPRYIYQEWWCTTKELPGKEKEK